MIALTEIGRKLVSLDELSGPIFADAVKTELNRVADAGFAVEEISLDQTKDWLEGIARLEGELAQRLNSLNDGDFHSLATVLLAQFKDATNFNTTVGEVSDSQLLSALAMTGKKVA